MEKIKSVIATLVLGISSLPYKLMAQDESSYIESLGVQDSSYMEEGNPIPAGSAEQASGSGNMAIIIVVAVVVIAAVVFFILRKKKK